MKSGFNLPQLIDEVQSRSRAKRDLLAHTREQLRMVPMEGFPNGVALVTLPDGLTELTRYEITDTCHGQIAAFLNIPSKYYIRLLKDHKDLVLDQVNALFEREPALRMVRTVDNRARAFLSDSYKRIDNDFILAKTLPSLMGREGDLPQNRVLQSYVTDDAMNLTVLWTDDSLRQDVGPVSGGRDTVRPGFRLSNSETGKGGVSLRAFFYRDYCENGCVFGDGVHDLTYSRYHLGGKLKQVNGLEIFSDATKEKDDIAMIAQLTDIMRALGSRDFVNRMGDTLRSLRTGEVMASPKAGIVVLSKEVGIYESELDALSESLYRSGDYSRWGALNAITSVANLESTTETRAIELQETGGLLVSMNQAQWSKIANAGRIEYATAAAA